MLTRRFFISGSLSLAGMLMARPSEASAKSYFPASVHQAIQAKPDAIVDIYAAHRARFVSDLGPGFAGEPEEHIRLAFASVMAYDLKPYGNCTVIGLEEMLAAPVWDCDNYVAATWHFYNFLVRKQKSKVLAIGWDKGPIGNHAQMMARQGDNRLLVDPTIGLVQYGCSFDWIASGRPCGRRRRKVFLWRSDPEIRKFRDQVVGALARGEYRPSQLLYVFEDLKKFSAPPPMASWPTPAVISRWR